MAEFRHIVRVAGVDLSGGKRVLRAIRDIDGVSYAYANAVFQKAGVPDKKIGDLSDAEVAQVEAVLKNPAKFGFPHWLYNRRKDPETGEDLHILGTAIEVSKRDDIGRMQKSKTYKGIRHALGLTVRGQRTRSTGRKGASVGVKRKTLQAAAKPADKKSEGKK